MTAVQSRPSANREIPIRKLPDDTGEAIAATATSLLARDGETWLVPGDPIFSHFLAMLSSLFPHGEEFFVRTVRENRRGFKENEVLRKQVNAFIGQEAMHGREHRALNDELAELGYPTPQIDAGTKIVSDMLLKLPGSLPLAVTSAAEHLTGTFAPEFLRDTGTRAVFLSSNEELAMLVQWHALEELEHKNVAFDVLEDVSGSYFVRAGGFWVMLATYGAYGATSWVRAVRKDRSRITKAHRKQFLQNLRRQTLLGPRSLWKLLEYLKPGFHPDDTNTDFLVEEWRVNLADKTVAVGRKNA